VKAGSIQKMLIAENSITMRALYESFPRAISHLAFFYSVEIEADHVARVIIGATILYVSIQDRRNSFTAQI